MVATAPQAALGMSASAVPLAKSKSRRSDSRSAREISLSRLTSVLTGTTTRTGVLPIARCTIRSGPSDSTSVTLALNHFAGAGRP